MIHEFEFKKKRQSLFLLLISVCIFVASLLRFVKCAIKYKNSITLRHQNYNFNWNNHGFRRLQKNPEVINQKHESLRVLYMITSLSEYDTGRRATTAGRDRFREILVPVVSESVKSMVAEGYNVTVCLISHYKLTNARYHELKRALSATQSALYFWSDATPYGYAPDNPNGENRIDLITRALARQHRFVIKDWLFEYDFFVAFEDDMLIHGAQVKHYHQFTNHLFQLRQRAPESLPIQKPFYFGPMTQTMLRRIIPGFIRVEVVPNPHWKTTRRKPLKNNAQNNNEETFPDFPVDYFWDSGSTTTNNNNNNQQQKQQQTVDVLDPSICCHWLFIPDRPQPTAQHLRFWETSIEAIKIRQLPDQTWVMLQYGNDESVYSNTNIQIQGFTLGRGQIPQGNRGDFMNNQGGWMATRRQILEWHMERCVGGFLPPYDKDSLLTRGTVEFWSGGLQLVGTQACNLQRIIPLEPQNFSKALLYHTSNNKQRQPSARRRFASLAQFWGQLNAGRKVALQQKIVELEQFKSQLNAWRHQGKN